MKRKLAATCIAVIISVPLIPLLEKGFERLTGTNAPMVFPAQGWTVEHEKTHTRGTAFVVSGNHYAVTRDQSNSLASAQDDVAGLALALGSRRCVDPWRYSEPLNLARRLNLLPLPGVIAPDSRNSCEVLGSDVLSVSFDDSGKMDWRRPTLLSGSRNLLGEFTILTIAAHGYQTNEFESASSNSVEPVVLGTRIGSAGSVSILVHVSKNHNWRLDHTAHADVASTPSKSSKSVPTVSSISQLDAIAGARAFTLTVNGSEFASGSTVNLNTSESTILYSVGIATTTVANNTAESQLSASINYLAQYPSQVLSLPAISTTRLPNPEMWNLTSRAYLQLAREWPQEGAQINSSRINELIQTGTLLAEALKNASDVQEDNANSVAQQPQRVNTTGWYSLDVGDTPRLHAGPIELEFVPDTLDPGEKRSIVENITERITIGTNEVTIDLCYLPNSSEAAAKGQRNLTRVWKTAG